MSNLRDVLQGTYDRRGELTPSLVVDEARPADAPLHDRFEWDDVVAGEEYRRVQAAELIRSVKIEFATGAEPKSVRAWVARRDVGDKSGGYQPIEEVAQDDLAMKLLLKQCERDITELRRKYGHLAEFTDLMRRAAAS